MSFYLYVHKGCTPRVMSELTSDAFLATFKRFISRRGRPCNIYSDNDSLANEDTPDLLKIQGRFDKFKASWHEFESVQSKIEDLDTDFDENQAAREQFEDHFCSLEARAKGLLLKYDNKGAPMGTHTTSDANLPVRIIVQ
nr:unnamed protein product [Callosobruchus analis]